MFAFEHSGVEPDLLCVAKSIAAGLPLSALVGKAELLDKIAPGGMGSTYGGNPVACAAALVLANLLLEPEFQAAQILPENGFGLGYAIDVTRVTDETALSTAQMTR